MGFTTKPANFWNSGNGQNIRQFFENFAKNREFDPIVVDNWYSLSTDFMNEKVLLEDSQICIIYNSSFLFLHMLIGLPSFLLYLLGRKVHRGAVQGWIRRGPTASVPRDSSRQRKIRSASKYDYI